MRVLQLNLNRCKVAQDLLSQSVGELNIDVAIIGEQNADLDSATWVSDCSGKAAIWACGSFPIQGNVRQGDGFARAVINNTYIYSYYVSPNIPIEDFEESLARLLADARGRSPIIIGGDFNAWAVEWGNRITNRRGRVLLEAIASTDLVLVNSGNSPTFRRDGFGSVVDLTFLNGGLVRAGFTWEVSEHYTHSDHQAILCELKDGRGQKFCKPAATRWKESSFDKSLFSLVLVRECAVGPAENKANQVMKMVSRACDATMPRKRCNTGRQSVYWWTNEIASLRKSCLRARRMYQRARGRETFAALGEQYKAAKKSLMWAIKSNKRRCWKELCDEVESDPWGRPYRIVVKKLRGLNSPTITCSVLLRRIVATLFPYQLDNNVRSAIDVDEATIPIITNEELLLACSRIGDRKASGPDGIPNVALKAAIRECPNVFADLFNTCMKEGIFPAPWKEQRLVLLPKGKKPPEEPSSYRPLCMLDTVGKVLERIVSVRLSEAIEVAEGLAEHQFGFRSGRSAVDAIALVVKIASNAIEGKRWKQGAKKYCAIITLDIKNAFNSAGWGHIENALSRIGVPAYLRRMVSAYLSQRKLKYDTAEGTRTYEVTGGVPQGSVLGPLLWNVMYDGVFNLNLPNNVEVVGFADDIAVVVTAKFTEEVTRIGNEAIETIRTWLDTVGLQLAEHKTEAVLVSSRKISESVNFLIGDHEIKSSRVIKYLGVMIDDRLSFGDHVKYACGKAAKVSAALARLMPNVGGARASRRMLLASVPKSIMLYASPIWASALKMKTYGRKMASVYRLGALRVISAYRTVSDEAAGVISGMLPIDIIANERSRLWHGSSDSRLVVRAESLSEWQRRWDLSEKGRWTHRLIPDLKTWLDRRQGEVNYYLTQFLTGHGCFRAYLHRFKIVESPLCPECDVTEDVEHTFFDCPRFQETHRTLWEVLGGRATPESIINRMLTGEQAWTAMCEAAANIMVQLRQSSE